MDYSPPENACPGSAYPFCTEISTLVEKRDEGSMQGRSCGMSVTDQRYHKGRRLYKAAGPGSSGRFDRMAGGPLVFGVCPEGEGSAASPRPMRISDEEDVPTEQPPTKANARLPGPDADEGWAARPEAPPPEGPQADRALRQRTLGGQGDALPAPGAPAARRRLRRRVQAGPAPRRTAVPPAGRAEPSRSRPARPRREPAGGRCRRAEPRPPAASRQLPSSRLTARPRGRPRARGPRRDRRLRPGRGGP